MESARINETANRKMKKFITVLVLVILSNKIFAQENMDWVDSILNKILLKKNRSLRSKI